MKAVLAQIDPALGDTERNLGIHLEEMRRASRAGADLIVFPELSLTGYLLKDLVADCAQDPTDSRLLKRLAAAGRKMGLAAVVGFVERGPGLALYNSAGCFLGGELVHLHRKVYLPTYGMFDEGRYFGAGDVFRTFDAPWGRTGILICEDFWHVSSSYLLAQSGMEVLVVISSSPTKAMDDSEDLRSRTTWVTLSTAVARFLSCFVLYVNRVGCEDGWSYSGGSFALAPSGERLAEGKLFAADRPAARLRPGVLRRVRVATPLLRDEKLDLVRRELDRVAAARYGTE